MRKQKVEKDQYGRLEGCNKLWVDKYRPNRITELLGDATVQRHILHFVRDWKRNLSTTLRSKNEKLSVSCWNVAKTGNKNTLIICGPPGIGKTVSIPVFLQHVGFQVHYVSAIEENSCETLQSKIEAFRNKSCLFSNPLPPCIVLDDVVFAAGHTHVDKCIKLLVDNGKRGSSSTDSFKTCILAVVICEDAFSKGLAPLRPLSKIFYFRESDTKSLQFRSLKVLSNERKQVDNSHDVSEQETEFLRQLCETAAGDIRWVLNQLQFVSNRFESLPFPNQQTEEFKDLSRGNIIDIMKAIFHGQNKEQLISNRCFQSLSVAEYNSLFDICPTIAMKAIETGDDLKQLTEVLDWQFSFENLYGSASYGTGLVVNDIGALILKKYTNLLRDANFLKHFHEKRLERQRIQNNMTALEELRNSWISSFARFDKILYVAEVYPRLTSLIYHSIKNASNLTDMKQRIEAVQKITKVCVCYGISIVWESNPSLEEATDIQSCCKSWNFVPSLPDLSYFETMSSWQAQNQSLMETLSIVIGLLEGSYKSVEHSACQQEANDDSLFIPRSAATSSENDRIATSIGYRFHEGHNNAILKPVTIDMLTC